ncbi:MAG: hypothetical protein Q8L87_20535 [Anaerolineales bacterium]|jgi:hypothetical protein|nr:hypothetical protein [Anaerolineales bacterium]
MFPFESPFVLFYTQAHNIQSRIMTTPMPIFAAIAQPQPVIHAFVLAKAHKGEQIWAGCVSFQLKPSRRLAKTIRFPQRNLRDVISVNSFETHPFHLGATQRKYQPTLLLTELLFVLHQGKKGFCKMRIPQVKEGP